MKPINEHTIKNPTAEIPRARRASRRLSASVLTVAMLTVLMPIERVAAALDKPCATKTSKSGAMEVIEIRPEEQLTYVHRSNGRFSKKTGKPLVLYEVDYRVNPGPPEAMAMQYLRENADRLHIANKSIRDLVTAKAKSHPAGHTVRFYQYFNEIPVYNSKLAITVNKRSTVVFVVNDYQPNVWVPTTDPSVTSEEAKRTAIEYLCVDGELMHESSRLVIYPFKGNSRLAWELHLVPRLSPIGDWEILVDAQTGSLLKVTDISASMLRHGKGNIYDPDPLSARQATYGSPGYVDGDATDIDGVDYGADTPQLNDAREVSQNLLELDPDDNGKYRLRGPKAHIIDESPPYNGYFTQDASEFDFTRAQPGFEAVNAYYHIDRFMRYVHETLDIFVRPYQHAYHGVFYDPHAVQGTRDSFYMASTGNLLFGVEGIDHAEDADMILHELGHGLHDWITCSEQPPNCGFSDDTPPCNCGSGGLSNADGLSEGVGDYFAASYSRSLNQWPQSHPEFNRIFNWIGRNADGSFGGRILNYLPRDPMGNPLPWTDNNSSGALTGNPHTDGQWFANCTMQVWDYFSAISPTVARQRTDKLVLVGLSMTDNTTSQFDAATAIWQAAEEMEEYSQSEADAIKSIYSNCYLKDIGSEVGPIAPDLTVTELVASNVRLRQGEEMDLTATVQNFGNGDSGGTANLHYYLSDNSGPIATFEVPLLEPAGNPGETFEHVFEWTAPESSGTFWLGACVEPVSGEGNRSNQCSPGVEIVIFEPFACTGEPLIIHDTALLGIEAQLSEIDQAASPFDFRAIDRASGFEFNAMGFRQTDGLLYAAMLNNGLTSGNLGIVMIDSTPTLLWAGTPLPLDVRFSAADISSDGQTMYMTAFNEPLYIVDLTSIPPTATSVMITGNETGVVHDWAYNPIDGKLYGGDHSHGQLAVLEVTGLRTDYSVPGLPTGKAYGGAWFDASGMLNLYCNDGSIYKIDPTIPEIVEFSTGGPEASRNDVASCPQKTIGIAVDMTAEPAGLATRVTIVYTFENFSPTEDLHNLTAVEHLESVFGTHDSDWRFVSISSLPHGFANQNFDGHTETELIAAGQILRGGSIPASVSSVTVQIDVLTDALSDNGKYCNQVMVFGDTSITSRAYGDRSTAGLDPDSNADGSPDEREPTCVNVGVEKLVCSGSGEVFIVQDEEGISQLYRCDLSLPLSCSPIAPLEFDDQPIEVNNLGYRASDETLLALQLNADGNDQLIQIDASGKVFGSGRPEGLPPEVRFDAGDVSADGTTLFLSRSGLPPFYTVDLTASPLTATEVTITGSTVVSRTGTVSDWAVHPTNGKLYGGDSTGVNGQGQLAVIDPGPAGSVTAIRNDVTLPGLPTGKAFGGAWFDDSGHLILYRNDGRVFEVDIDIPAIIQEVDESEAAHFDGASCKP